VSNEIRVWRVVPEQIAPGEVASQDELVEIKRGHLDLESRLEAWLVKDISLLDRDLLVIGQQVETDFGGYIDLLCLDANGDLVIVELKRDKTPREVTAQVLDYASWVADLPGDKIRSIADGYLRRSKHTKADDLDDAFRQAFGGNLPDTLNADHRMLVVGSVIDQSSERIIRYLSDKHGLRINAASFQYFRTSDGTELIARVFVIELSDEDRNARTKGSSKRRPNLSLEELERIADEKGVADLYSHALSVLGSLFPQRRTTLSSLGFEQKFDGHRKVVINLIPQDSTDGRLKFQVYKSRYATLANIPVDKVKDYLPGHYDDWAYDSTAGPDWEGYEGLIDRQEDIDRIATPLTLRAAVPHTD
jgi:Endonuclease NucS